MPMMDWDARFSVGIAQFDRDHHVIIDLINELFDAVQAGRGQEALGQTLNRLLNYTKTHMIAEEKSLETYAHRLEHEALAHQIFEIRQRYNAGAATPMCMEVLTLMKKWLIEHIQGTDKHYQDFLNAQGLF